LILHQPWCHADIGIDSRSTDDAAAGDSAFQMLQDEQQQQPSRSELAAGNGCTAASRQLVLLPVDQEHNEVLMMQEFNIEMLQVQADLLYHDNNHHQYSDLLFHHEYSEDLINANYNVLAGEYHSCPIAHIPIKGPKDFIHHVILFQHIVLIMSRICKPSTSHGLRSADVAGRRRGAN
jgi:hypothetical protein